MRFAQFLIATACAAASLSAPAASTPKQIVTTFFDLAFVQRKPTEAALKCISAQKYIQHNPNGTDGREAFIKGFAAYVERGAYRCEIKRVIAEADLVVVHNNCKEDPSSAADRGAAVIDIFRVEGDKIVEHWDVEQPVPAQSKNKNTMF